MKRRNLFLSLLLAGACAVVGIGYSTITRALKIGGQLAAAKNDNSLKVEFQEEQAFSVTTTTAIVATPKITNEHAANLDVSGMVDIGDKAEAYFLIKNESQPTKNLDATLTIPNIIVTNGSITAEDKNTAETNVFKGKHFEITAEYVTSVDGKLTATGKVNDDGTASLAAAVDVDDPANDKDGETVWVKVSVELIDVIIVDTFPPHNITISFSASTVADSTPVQPK